MSKSELIIEYTVRATNTDKYSEVVLGTFEARFEPSGKPTRLVRRMGKKIGFSKDLNIVFLESLEIQPKMIELKNDLEGVESV